MAVALVVLALALALRSALVDAAIVEHTFHVRNMTVKRLCEGRVITAVNGQYPGPTIETNNGDTVVVHVVNESPYGITIHWHGVIQRLNCWADGASMITQCPITPGNRQTYRFNVTEEEGTLWWHAHVSYLRITVHGALIIRPKEGTTAYPFTKPDAEVTIALGEWWKANMIDVERKNLHGNFKFDLNSYTINGKPGDLYKCSNNSEDVYKLEVNDGKTYMLRIINTAFKSHFFFKIASHTFTVVAVDAGYAKPYGTDVIVIAPGQTVDAIIHANAPPSCYYMVAQPYMDASPPPPFLENTTARGVMQYASASWPTHCIMPKMPEFHDPQVAHRFSNSLSSLIRPEKRLIVPLNVDEKILITFGMGYICNKGQNGCELTKRLFVASMNNVSFQLPRETSLLEAHYKRVKGVYTQDFPDKPPLFFNFTDSTLHNGPMEELLGLTSKGTKVKRLRYNSTIEVVLQSTTILATESHPIHLHGHNFFVLAHGFGNYNAETVEASYNLIDPLLMNTIAVPRGGWAVIRFTANNPGVWFMHCHMDLHSSTGLATIFEVENGPTPETSLPPPPEDLPRCASAN